MLKEKARMVAETMGNTGFKTSKAGLNDSKNGIKLAGARFLANL